MGEINKMTTREKDAIAYLIYTSILTIIILLMGFLLETCRHENIHNKAYIDTLQTEISLLRDKNGGHK